MPIIKYLGDDTHAEQIFNATIKFDKLEDSAAPEIFELLGFLKYAPVKPILVDYIFKTAVTDYYSTKYAVLGLLHFDCSEYQDIIKTTIADCYGKNLFPEFIPTLVAKLDNPSDILEKLYELGNDYASTDCNAGIVLGFSLCGNQGRDYFKRMLFNPNWETNSTGTGTVYFAYRGLQNLGITFKDLYIQIKLISDKEQLKYSLSVFFALLNAKIDDIEMNKGELFSDLYTMLFKRQNDTLSDNLMELASTVEKQDDVYELQGRLEMKMKEEAILKNFKTI
ncbi:hypothetical protein [Sediminibacterium sp.]|uniref:hypothetical protein n=1 Tax=Sediminibacterium sp. TaxID=1917865 RepID=UPI003F7053BF